jgi:hypothetical protein
MRSPLFVSPKLRKEAWNRDLGDHVSAYIRTIHPTGMHITFWGTLANPHKCGIV